MKTLTGQMKLSLLVLVICLSAFQANGFRQPDSPQLGNYDVRTVGSTNSSKLTPEQEKAAVELKARVATVQMDIDPVIQSPAWIVSTVGFLTAPTEIA